MKRKIFILDAFTNGHEAALEFIKRQGWNLLDCEILFCGNHANVLKQLCQEQSYAVVPVKNSIVGEVGEVVGSLGKLRESGYELHEVDHLDLPINHCLLAPSHITDPQELEEILSHEKALAQCGMYLDSIGITKDSRITRESTGNAAKVVARSGVHSKVGAIASEVAAQEYGLRILAQNIQDVPDNKTTFILLHNQAYVRPVIVGIIGIEGAFGKMLKKFFEEIGCTVIGSDSKNTFRLTNEDVVCGANVVVFSIPIDKTVETIEAVTPFVRSDQLLIDVTSIKQPAVEALCKTKGQVVSLHPMFRPEMSFEGQTVVVCPERLTQHEWKTWVVNMLALTKSTLKWSNAVEHDTYMTTVQVLPHLGNLTSAVLVSRLGISMKDSLEFTSPFYRVMASLMGRLVSQNPNLYTSIIMDNPETLAMLEQRIQIEQRLADMIREQDRAGFAQLFDEACEHFGPDITKEANELFMRLLGVLNTLYGKNSVMLEFDNEHSQPGLLGKILTVFANRHINLTGINSVLLGHRLQFAISFEESRSTDQIRRALEEIENWNECKAIVSN